MTTATEAAQRAAHKILVESKNGLNFDWIGTDRIEFIIAAEFSPVAPALLDEVQTLRARVSELEENVTKSQNSFNWINEQSKQWSAEAEARAQQTEAENGRLRSALELLAETCEEHRVRYNEQSASIFGHAPSAQEYWSGRRDEAGHLRDKLQAALAAPAPETGEWEAEIEVLKRAVKWYESNGSIGTEKLWEATAMLFGAKALRARASVAGGGEG